MTRFSYNGWPVVEEPDAGRLLTTLDIAGRKFHVLAGDVAVVFAELIGRFHREVEPINVGVLDDWSYAVRLTRGSTTSLSCHSSGTAVDLDATHHPRGKQRTFSAAQVRAIDAILADLPCIRWGGLFHTVPDEMHFEITDRAAGGSPADVARVAAAIRARQEEETVDAAQEDRIAAKARDAVLTALGLNPKDPRIVTGWKDDGTHTDDPARAQRVTVAKALAGDRGGSLHAAVTADAIAVQVDQLQQAVAALTALVQAAIPPGPAGPAGPPAG